MRDLSEQLSGNLKFIRNEEVYLSSNYSNVGYSSHINDDEALHEFGTVVAISEKQRTKHNLLDSAPIYGKIVPTFPNNKGKYRVTLIDVAGGVQKRTVETLQYINYPEIGDILVPSDEIYLRLEDTP